MVLVLLTVVLVIAADVLTKYIMAGLLPPLPERTLPVIRDVLHFTYVENEGAAFGMLSEHRWIFMVLSVLGLCAIAFLVAKEKPKSPWVRLAAGLVLGGGIGNMIDRLGFGFAETKYAVLDFIDCRFINFYVFNVADACVTVGCFLYLFLTVVAEIRAAKEKKAASAKGESPEGSAEADENGESDPEDKQNAVEQGGENLTESSPEADESGEDGTQG